MQQMTGPLSVIGLSLLGIALLWAVRLAYGNRGTTSDDVMRLMLTISGWLLIQVGVIGVVAQVFFVRSTVAGTIVLLIAGVIATLVLLAAFGMAVTYYRTVEWRSLLWTLSAAAEKGIPIDQAARAFALERTDEIGVRVARLANLLSAGVALPEALASTSSRLPLDGVLAARIAAETGDLGRTIARLAQRDIEQESLFRAIIERILYFTVMLASLAAILLFVLAAIVPPFSQLFMEFDIEIPEVTHWVIQAAEVGRFWALLVLPLLGLILLGVAGEVLLYYVGWLPADFPGTSWITRRYDGARVMRALALSVDQNRPIASAVLLLARVYPKRSVRNRLTTASAGIEQGADWTQCLRSSGLILPADAAVLQAAQRVGNLAWALDEMAESTVRRGMYRIRILLNLFFPLAVVAVGVVVAVLVVGLFWPLVELIHGVTPGGGFS